MMRLAAVALGLLVATATDAFAPPITMVSSSLTRSLLSSSSSLSSSSTTTHRQSRTKTSTSELRVTKTATMDRRDALLGLVSGLVTGLLPADKAKAIGPDMEKGELVSLTNSFLEGSNLMYAFASLRQAVDEAEREGKPVYNRELIFRDPDSPNDEIPVKDVYDFVKLNEDLIPTTQDEMDARLNYHRSLEDILEAFVENKIDISLREFDDQKQDTEAVYGITINRTSKRIGIFFRGSVQGNNDWSTNIKVLQAKLDPASKPPEERFSDKTIRVHGGFNSYLNDPRNVNKGKLPVWVPGLYDGVAGASQGIASGWNDLQTFASQTAPGVYDGLQQSVSSGFATLENNIPIAATTDAAIQEVAKRLRKTSTKYDDIVEELNSIIPRYSDYELFISGHSLGGALSQLLAFQLASDRRLEFKLKHPITAITYASPQVGDRVFHQEFQVLEDDKNPRLRHLRISNEGDVIPYLWPWGYEQAGVHMYLRDGSLLGLGDPKAESIPDWWTPKLRAPIRKFFDNHMLDESRKRLEWSVSNQDPNMEGSIDEIYRKLRSS